MAECKTTTPECIAQGYPPLSERGNPKTRRHGCGDPRVVANQPISWLWSRSRWMGRISRPRPSRRCKHLIIREVSALVRCCHLIPRCGHW